MIKKLIFILIFFYFLTLIQASFLINLKILGITINLVLVSVIIISFFIEEPLSALTSAFMAGFYLDIFSVSNFWFFGFYTLISLIISFMFIKLGQYFSLPRIKMAKR